MRSSRTDNFETVKIDRTQFLMFRPSSLSQRSLDSYLFSQFVERQELLNRDLRCFWTYGQILPNYARTTVIAGWGVKYGGKLDVIVFSSSFVHREAFSPLGYAILIVLPNSFESLHPVLNRCQS